MAPLSSLLLLRLFIKKMKQLISDLNVLSNSADLQRKQFQFVSIMAQLSCLITACIVSTLISIIGIVFTAFNSSFYFAAVSILIGSLDVAINALCMILHWQFAHSCYRKLCGHCHKNLTTMYLNQNSNHGSRNHVACVTTNSDHNNLNW